MRALLNAPSPDNIVFGMNMTTLTFHLSRIISRDWQAGDEVIVTALDHYANVSSWQQAAADQGAVVHQIPLEGADCALDAAKVCERINANTRRWRSATLPTSPAASSISKPSSKLRIGSARRCMSTPCTMHRTT